MEDSQQHKSFLISDGLKALRKIERGELILKEKPLLWGPAFNALPVCLGCGRKLNPVNYRNCHKCNFPVCDENCEKSPEHLPECRYASQRGIRIEINHLEKRNRLYDCVLILRCLYTKLFFSKKWRKLEKFNKTLEKHSELVFFIRHFFKLWSVPIHDLQSIWELVVLYSFEISADCVALYANASLLETTCRANCSVYYTSNGDLLLRAAEQIPEGDILSVSLAPLLPTPQRRVLLHSLRFFWCDCSRCRDVSEFSTNFSALNCPNCQGVLLPQSFADLQPNSHWFCQRCASMQSSFLVACLLEQVEKDFQSVEKSLEKCCEFWNNYKSSLHENHYYFFRMQLVLCEILDDLESLSDEKLALKSECCQNVEKLVRLLAPGEWRVLGRVLYEKVRIVKEVARRSKTNFCKLNLEEILQEVIELLDDVSQNLPEAQICEKAKQDLREIKHSSSF